MSSEPVLKLTSTVQGQSEIVFDQGDVDQLVAILAPLVAAILGDGGNALAPLEDRMFSAERKLSSMLSKGEIVDLIKARVARAMRGRDDEPKPRPEPEPDPTPKPRR